LLPRAAGSPTYKGTKHEFRGSAGVTCVTESDN
jgi:hypothetical protein